jgi:small subunit ribosomal protein S20
MPIKKASFKSVRKDQKRRLVNLRITSELKTLNKKFEVLITANKPDEAKQLLPVLISHIAKAAAKGVLHKNTASRKIGRLTKRLAKLAKGQGK